MRTSNPAQEFSEQQAAESLGIGLDDLYRLLDEHIFNDGTPRPKGLLFTQTDMLLLSYWCTDYNRPNVLRMPRRR